jgi:hypothetical protein
MNTDCSTLSFPRRANGLRPLFFWADIDSAGALRSLIEKIFDRHRQAVEIDVFEGEREAGLFRRPDRVPAP